MINWKYLIINLWLRVYFKLGFREGMRIFLFFFFSLYVYLMQAAMYHLETIQMPHSLSRRWPGRAHAVLHV